MNKEQVKAKAAAVKAKAKGMKEKIKAKVKGGRCAAVALALCAALAGCMDTNPASRQNAATYGDIVVRIGDGAASNSVSVVVGDGVVASADSSGSTETQTATPTLDIRTKIDARYNDALAAATTASRSTLGFIGDGITGVLDLMASKKSGTVQVTKKDGTAATVECNGGQCSFVK